MSTTTASNAHILAAARTLHERRARLAIASAVVAERRAAWEQQHAVAIDTERVARQECADAEAQLRELAVAHYEATGDKAPGFGVSVVINVRAEISDEPAVMGWAKASGTGLVLDRKAIEKAAKAGLEIPGVWLNTEPAARIATDLSTVLAEAPAAAGEGA